MIIMELSILLEGGITAEHRSGACESSAVGESGHEERSADERKALRLL